MVRLKEKETKLSSTVPIQFQFLYGAIKRQLAPLNMRMRQHYFNSSMVRLKANADEFGLVYTDISIPLWCD